MDQGGNYWTLFTPRIWKDLHAVLHPNLREDARNRIKRLDVHPPEEEGGPPRIILEGNLPQMLRLAGVDTMKKGHPYGAAFLDRVIDSSIKRDPGARPLVGCGATPRA